MVSPVYILLAVTIMALVHAKPGGNSAEPAIPAVPTAPPAPAVTQPAPVVETTIKPDDKKKNKPGSASTAATSALLTATASLLASMSTKAF